MSDDRKRRTLFGFLVYVLSWTGRISPQRWPDLYFGERGDRRHSVVAVFPLTEPEVGLSLDDLAHRHPMPADTVQPSNAPHSDFVAPDSDGGTHV